MSANAHTRSPLILLQSAPYTGLLAKSAIDLALSFAVFSQQPRLLFCGDGVLSLVAEQDVRALGRKSLGKIIDSLPLYDIDEIFVEAESVAQYGLSMSQLPEFASAVSRDEARHMREQASHVISL